MATMPKQKMILSDAYLAGIVDGEGCVRISRHKCSHVAVGYRFEPYLDITSTDKQLLDAIKKYLNCGQVRAKKMYVSNRKQGYVWTAYGRACGQVLTELLPYLNLKKQQAKLVIKYVSSFCRTNRVGYRLTDKERATQLYIFNKVAALNKRGI